jgi:hypothetical protein
MFSGHLRTLTEKDRQTERNREVAQGKKMEKIPFQTSRNLLSHHHVRGVGERGQVKVDFSQKMGGQV